MLNLLFSGDKIIAEHSVMMLEEEFRFLVGLCWCPYPWNYIFAHFYKLDSYFKE